MAIWRQSKDGNYVDTSQGTSVVPENERGQKKNSPLEDWREYAHTNTLILDVQTAELWENKFLLY